MSIGVAAWALTSIDVILFPLGQRRAHAILHELLRLLDPCGRTDLFVQNSLLALEKNFLCVVVGFL